MAPLRKGFWVWLQFQEPDCTLREVLSYQNMYSCESVRGTIIIHEHTRVGTGFRWTVLVTAHCPVLKTGQGSLRIVPSALASNVPGA